MGWFKWNGRMMPGFLMLEHVPSIVRFEQVTTVVDMPLGTPLVYTPQSFKSYTMPLTIGLRPRVWDRDFMNTYTGENYTDNQYSVMSVQEIEEMQFTSVYNWLSGKGTLTFSNDPERCYTGVCNSQIVPERISRNLRKIQVQFTLVPFRQYIEEASQIINLNAQKEAWLNYHGTYPSEPTIKLYGNGELGIQWGTDWVRVTDVSEFCVIDVSTRRVYDKDGNIILNRTEGDFTKFRYSQGRYIKAGPNVTKVEVNPNTRWR